MHHSDLQVVLDKFQAAHSAHERPSFYVRLSFVNRVFYHIPGFSTYYKIRDFDFIYDRSTGLFLVDIQGPHVILLADLYRYWTGLNEPDDYKAADAYIENGWGMFRSRAKPGVMKASDWELGGEWGFLRRDIIDVPEAR